MECEVRRITNGSKHHLFGFHDLVQTNAKGDMALALEVEDISRPPLPGEVCLSGIVPSDGGEFVPVHTTHTWNYPMGARQQWLGESDLFTCNDRDSKGNLVSLVCDAKGLKEVDRLPFPIHCHDPITRKAFYINYDRLYRLGAYGYCGGVDEFANFDIPDKDGVWVGDMKTGGRRLMVSIKEVAQCGEARTVETGFPHYVTHLSINPSGTRLAFLHEYRVRDGGDVSRLMTIGTDGRDLRCLAKGLASHFDWVDDENIIFWGHHSPARSAIRESPRLSNPLYRFLFCMAKQTYRAVRHVRVIGKTQNGMACGTDNYGLLLATDKEWADHPFLRNVKPDMVEDVHPMSNPMFSGWIVHDTYPDKAGYRQLALYNYKTGVTVQLARLRRLVAEPDIHGETVPLTTKGVEKRVLKHFALRDYLFTRSGLHCDFHPRWSYDGKTVYFDSTHEGTRQVYGCYVGSLI